MKILIYRIFTGYGVYLLAANNEIDEACIVDPSLPSDEFGNYMDCNSEDNLQTGNTECCDVDGQVGCCAPGGQ